MKNHPWAYTSSEGNLSFLFRILTLYGWRNGDRSRAYATTDLYGSLPVPLTFGSGVVDNRREIIMISI